MQLSTKTLVAEVSSLSLSYHALIPSADGLGERMPWTSQTGRRPLANARGNSCVIGESLKLAVTTYLAEDNAPPNALKGPTLAVIRAA